MNNIKICDNCPLIDVDTLSKKIRSIDSDAQISIGCQNFCGICSAKAFAILNNIPIIEDDQEKLVVELTKKMEG